MTSRRDLTSLMSGVQEDRFLAVVEQLQSEADPIEQVSFEIVAGGRRYRATRTQGRGRQLLHEHMSRDAVGFELIVDSLRGRLNLPRPAGVAQALRNAELRTAFMSEVGGLSAAEVAELAGSRAKNTSALASRWRAQRRVFAVPWAGELIYPAFQFENGVPRPVIAQILDAFGAHVSAWETALWFATPSAYLQGNARPLERLDDPPALIAAVNDELSLPEF